MERINGREDCCYVVPGTATVSLHHHRPLIEFDIAGRETLLDAGYFLKFQCVRGDATEEEVKSNNCPWKD